MKPETTAITRAPQSRRISASLRRLAVRRAGNVLAASALFALGATSAQAQVNYQYTGTTGTTDASVSGVFSRALPQPLSAAAPPAPRQPTTR